MWAGAERGNGNIYKVVKIEGEIREDIDKVDKQIQNGDIYICSLNNPITFRFTEF